MGLLYELIKEAAADIDMDDEALHKMRGQYNSSKERLVKNKQGKMVSHGQSLSERAYQGARRWARNASGQSARRAIGDYWRIHSLESDPVEYKKLLKYDRNMALSEALNKFKETPRSWKNIKGVIGAYANKLKPVYGEPDKEVIKQMRVRAGDRVIRGLKQMGKAWKYPAIGVGTLGAAALLARRNRPAPAPWEE